MQCSTSASGFRLYNTSDINSLISPPLCISLHLVRQISGQKQDLPKTMAQSLRNQIV